MAGRGGATRVSDARVWHYRVMSDPRFVTSVSQLEALYPEINPASLVKEATVITPQYRELIEASPFAALSTIGPGGMDCSPRGDRHQVVHVVDERTVHLPDRRGNNRLDSLRNIVEDGRVALLLLIPGLSECMRINGRAVLRCDDEVLTRYVVNDRGPTSVVEITAEAVYFQCAKAVLRSDLWNPANHCDDGSLPTAGQILASMSEGSPR